MTFYENAHIVPNGPLDFFLDLEPKLSDFRSDVLNGLSKRPKTISPKYFYDETGSKLFERITELEAYYPTRAELAAMDAHRAAIAHAIGPRAAIVEYGSGASLKVRRLLDSLIEPAAYVAIDISRDFLLASAATVARAYPEIAVGAVCADFVDEITLPDAIAADVRVGYFPGSTIGNLSDADAVGLLQRARRALGDNALFLLGADLAKDRETLEAAYNDPEGVTAAFNLNLLTRVRRELDAELDLSAFEHHAFFNAQKSRVEMHLRATKSAEIRIGDATFAFDAGESIHTENSRKFTPQTLDRLAEDAGWRREETWRDPQDRFAISLLRPAA